MASVTLINSAREIMALKFISTEDQLSVDSIVSAMVTKNIGARLKLIKDEGKLIPSEIEGLIPED